MRQLARALHPYLVQADAQGFQAAFFNAQSGFLQRGEVAEQHPRVMRLGQALAGVQVGGWDQQLRVSQNALLLPKIIPEQLLNADEELRKPPKAA